MRRRLLERYHCQLDDGQEGTCRELVNEQHYSRHMTRHLATCLLQTHVVRNPRQEETTSEAEGEDSNPKTLFQKSNILNFTQTENKGLTNCF